MEKLEKYVTFSVPIKKKCDNGKTVTQKLRFIDSFGFIPVSLSEYLDNLSGVFIGKVCIKCTGRNKINAEGEFDGLKGD